MFSPCHFKAAIVKTEISPCHFKDAIVETEIKTNNKVIIENPRRK